MAKVVNFNELVIDFNNFYTKQHYNQFLNSELGRIYQAIPWDVLVRFYTKRDKANKKLKGRPRKLNIRAGLAILILQAYTGLSARKLMEQISQNIYYQYFIGVKFLSSLTENEYFVIYRLARYYKLTLSEIKQLQKQLLQEWKSDIPDSSGIIMDATVFESNVTWPVMISLMDKVLSVLSGYRRSLSKLLGSRISNKKAEQLHLQFKQLIVKKKRNYKKHRQLEQSQVRLAKRYLKYVEKQLKQLENQGLNISIIDRKRLRVIRKLLEQRELSLNGNTVSHPIISLYKPYVYGIYRGKVRTAREYGLKYHMFEQGGLIWIEYISNKNFNETKRLKATVYYSWSLFGRKPWCLAADCIYQSRENNKFLKELGIKSNFRPLGRVKEGEKEQYRQLIRAINRARNRIEGVFGVLKTNYYTHRVRYKSMQSNILMVFLSTLIYNSLQISKYRQSKEKISKAS